MKTLTVGSYCTNCYMVWGENSDSCVLIDPGYEPELLLEQVQLAGKKLQAILLTHGHFDHIGGVKPLMEQTGCRVYICKEDLNLNPMLTAGLLAHTDTYADGDTLELAGLHFAVMHTPGHTPGGVCLLCEDTIFAGDTLFAGTCGRTDLPGSDHRQMVNSLRRLSQLEGDYRVLPGHGSASRLDWERQGNPFLQGL